MSNCLKSVHQIHSVKSGAFLSDLGKQKGHSGKAEGSCSWALKPSREWNTKSSLPSNALGKQLRDIILVVQNIPFQFSNGRWTTMGERPFKCPLTSPRPLAVLAFGNLTSHVNPGKLEKLCLDNWIPLVPLSA